MGLLNVDTAENLQLIRDESIYNKIIHRRKSYNKAMLPYWTVFTFSLPGQVSIDLGGLL